MSVIRHPSTLDRASLKPRILHIGFGAFARAHPMVYLQEGIETAGGTWGVVAARLNSGVDDLDRLAEADHLYHVAEADGDQTQLREIGVLCGTCHPARDGADALPALIASGDLSVILLTITEKGYCTSGGALDLTHPGIRADLEGAEAPRTAIGVLVAGLARRRAAGQGGLTILSCDNQPANGRLTRRAVLGFARAQDPELAAWIEGTVRFPSSMVDRIVPAMTDSSRAEVAEALGRDDANAILCEPFRQWVIEDDFAGEAPPFAAGGALLVPDVEPFEDMKLRLLNGAHTTLAWAGQLLGYETVAEAMTDAPLCAAVRRLMLAEQAPTLDLPAGVDVADYAEDLLARFTNTRLHHRLDQIATDTSNKMPQRLFAPVEQSITAGRPWPVAAVAIACWVTGLQRLAPIADPRQEALRAAAASDRPVAGVLAVPGVVPPTLAHSPEFESEVTAAYDRIEAQGLSSVLSALMEAT
ncbi:mannitol dehydrogenase family protein [Epibacterium sp. MM17-32]|uniref:mannitol dehydrogenase family protein n=1 Tax=Epibacterium sp. MM17-32 TaxID=2917734 RepID=UPI001EF5DDAC|nr:mannitol dehydrogenase family protein [Epibacterium sp. MM17-32]